MLRGHAPRRNSGSRRSYQSRTSRLHSTTRPGPRNHRRVSTLTNKEQVPSWRKPVEFRADQIVKGAAS